jgi:hypothetical protein
MSKDIRTDHEYQNAEFGDFGFRIFTNHEEPIYPNEKYSSIMALTDCNIRISSTRNGDAEVIIDLLAGMIIYGDLGVINLTGNVIAYLRGE